MCKSLRRERRGNRTRAHRRFAGARARRARASGDRVRQGPTSARRPGPLAKAVTAPRVADPSARPVSGSAFAEGWAVADNLAEAVAQAEVAVLAVPLPALPAVLGELAPASAGWSPTSPRSRARSAHLMRRRPVAVRRRASDGRARRPPGSWPPTRASSTAAPGCSAWSRAGRRCGDWLTLAALVHRAGRARGSGHRGRARPAVAAVSHVPHLLAAALASTADRDPLAAALGRRVFPRRHPGRGHPAGVDRGHVRRQRRRRRARPRRCARRPGGMRRRPRRRRPGRGPRVAARARRRRPPRLAAGARCSRGSCPREVDALLDLGRHGGWVSAVAADRHSLTALRPATDRNSL